MNKYEEFQFKANQSFEDRRSYEAKLETARGLDIYKYILLINLAALEGYVTQSRSQAQQSFTLSRIMAIAGFAIMAIAIVLSVFFTLVGNDNLNAAYLSGIAGVLIEFIAGVFFYLYSKTLGQINLFHDKLVEMQKTALSYISMPELNQPPFESAGEQNSMQFEA
jgi:uncharacterized membrane protein